MARFDFNAVIFDSDGVLVDSEVLGIDIEMELLAGYSLPYEKQEFIRRFMGLNDIDFVQALNIESRERLGTPLPDDFADRIVERKDTLYQTALKPVPGIEHLLDSLPHPKAVASSATVWELERNLELTGLIDRFKPHVYSADLVKAGKPAPDIFLHAAAQLETPPEECLVIEDSTMGVRAGLEAGMTVWGFIGGGHASEALGERLRAAGAHEVMRSHDEIRAVLSE
jgi:HAD superfamily hydrolase (TIGR01509 family)